MLGYMECQDLIKKPFKPKEIVHTIRRFLKKKFPENPSLVQQIDSFVEENAVNLNLKIVDICKEFDLSPSYVSLIFNQKIKMSFRERLAHFRIKMAKKLLTKTDQPLFQIAERCGFKNQIRFSETFEKYEKICPNRYRQIITSKEEGEGER